MMKSFLWFMSVSLVLAAMTGFVFLSDADLYDLLNGSSYHQQSRWKRSRLYPQYVLPPDQDKQHFRQEEEDGYKLGIQTKQQHKTTSADGSNSVKSRTPSSDKYEDFWSNENFAQLMSRPTPFPPNHFINQPYFEVKPATKTANDKKQQQRLNTEKPITSSNSKVTREVQHNGESPTKRTPYSKIPSAATAVAAIKEENFNDLDVVLKESESKNKPSFTKMFQKAISQRRIGKPKKSIKEQIDKKKLKQEIPKQRDYRHGGGGYGGHSYSQPPVYYIPNHKEKDFSGLLKLFLLAILIPLGICIALAVAAAFITGLSAYSRYLVTYVNSTNSTYYFINGFGGFANLFGLSGLSGISGLIGSSSSSSAAISQTQQQQQSSSNNNNNNNANSNNNNNAIAVIVVNITGRANKDNDFFRKPVKFKSHPIDQQKEEENRGNENL